MLDWLTCFAFNWFQRDLCLQLNIRCRRNSANTLSVEFTAKSFFPISPEIKKRIHGDECTSATPVDTVRTFRWRRHAIESAAVKQTQKQKGSIPDQNIQKDVKKNPKRTCLDFLLNQI